MRAARVFAIVAAVTGVSAGFTAAFDRSEARVLADGIIEERIDANLLRVKVHGEWEELPLMPLAEHLCEGEDPFYEQYCD